MQRMISRSSTGFLLGMLALAPALTSLACGGGGEAVSSPPPATASAGREIDCAGAKRPAADCSSPASSKDALKLGDASSKQEQKAIERISAELDALHAEQARLCEGYNACKVDEATYTTQSASIKGRIEDLPELTSAMANAKTYGARKRALDDLYRGVVPEEKRVEELTFRMGMRAELPASVGGGTIDVEPGGVVPTNARVAFAFEVSKDAHLYIFQKSPKDDVTVLFPDARIGTENPLRAGTWAEIPPKGQRFRVNDKDLGIENVFIIVSRSPIQSLDAALDKVKSGAVKSISQDSTLQAFTTVSAGTAPATCKTRALELDAGDAKPSCSRSRGLVLDDGAAPAAAAPSPGGGASPAASSAGSNISFTGRTVMEVRTDPGDDVIVKVFPFNHATEQGYTEAAQKAAANAKKGVKTRGLVVEY